MSVPVLRVARPTSRLEEAVAFYRDALGFSVLASFEDHDGFDGVMLGHPRAPWHVELTRERGVTAPDAPTAEHLLALYVGEEGFDPAVARLETAGAQAVPSHNPYWDAHGRTYVDPDGYRVVIARQTWEV
jgi:catechol 2,3-dioxygenase-like lactoylglutathione lyase family enzyme